MASIDASLGSIPNCSAAVICSSGSGSGLSRLRGDDGGERLGLLDLHDGGIKFEPVTDIDIDIDKSRSRDRGGLVLLILPCCCC